MLGPYQDYHLNMKVRLRTLPFLVIVLLLSIGAVILIGNLHQPLPQAMPIRGGEGHADSSAGMAATLKSIASVVTGGYFER
jgi:hypothetical protein